MIYSHFRFLACCLFLHSFLLFAHEDETPKKAEKKVHVLEGDRAVFGIGAHLGFTSGLGIQIGAWNIGHGGFITGGVGFFGLGISSEFEGGYMFDNEGSFKQGVSLRAGDFVGILPLLPILISEIHGGFIGPNYKMLFWNILSVDLGAAFYFAERRNGLAFLFFPTKDAFGFTLLPTVKVGANWFF